MFGLGRLFNRRRVADVGDADVGDADSQDILLAHFFRSLNDEFLYAQHPTGEPAIVNDAITQKIAKLFDEKENWDRSYEIQRLLAYIKPSSKLAFDVERRVSEAEALKLPTSINYRAQLAAATAALNIVIERANAAAAAVASAPQGEDLARRQAAEGLAKGEVETARGATDNQRRAILAAALDDLQWFYQKRNLVRRALHGAADNLLVFGQLTLLISASPYIYFLIERQFSTTFFSKFVEMMPNYGLYTAACFGLVGAFFSRLLSLNFTQSLSVEDAENLFSKRSLSIRASVGVCGAIIVYFLLHSQVIGLAAPDFSNLTFEVTKLHTLLGEHTVLLPSKDWALLVIWSVLAGFFERLVPDSLARAEGQVSSKKEART